MLLITPGHVEPAPRRVRGVHQGAVVFDTTAAVYIWDTPKAPFYAIPLADVDANLVAAVPHDVVEDGDARGHVRFPWDALDAWFEEDEQIFVHPRSPYTRVDALRSTRHLVIERDGVLLAESSSPVLVFETGVTTRYYVDRTCLNHTVLVETDTVTECPYKGRTTTYWSARTPRGVHPDIAWSYAFPTTGLAPIAGLVAFYTERVDLTLDGRRLPRP